MGKKAVQTLDDIARLANVSRSTVSRALNDSPLLNAATKARIQAIAHAHNFRINAAARNLRVRQSHTIAFVTPDVDPSKFTAESQFGFEILSAIGNGLRGLGYDLLIVHVNPRDTAWMHAYFDSGRVDGFILMTEGRKQAHIRKLVELGAPFITWGVPLPQFTYCTVTSDNLRGGTLATQRLLELGRQRIAFLGGPATDTSVQQRFQGYESALRTAGRSLDSNLVAYGDDYAYTDGIATMQRLLAAAPNLDGVFANSDLMALGAIKALREHGQRVPAEIAVVGYDDVSIAAYNTLPLTTIRQNIALAGNLLAQNLIQFIQTGVVTNVITPVELVIRESA
jgi:DNA-binding LacI/PurR family transcriptional regulator